MLILNRRVGEAVMIFDDITVTVLGVKGCQVRLGFAADASVPIHREEIHERIQHERALPSAVTWNPRRDGQRLSLRTNRGRNPEPPAPTVSSTRRDRTVDD